jgi:two-component system response regulator HydG
MEQMEQIHGTCAVPFEQGEICRFCRLHPEPSGLRRCSRLVAESAAMRQVLERAAAMARTQAPVVLLGETGTGKEVLARVLHASSPRAGQPFVAVNCAALPADLLESELFGHVRGAFSGAVRDKSGLFESAEGGTLLLDEIAEMPLPLQVKLLRVLQDGEVRRVGATREVTVNVRIFAATHRDLRARVEEGTFREDLYYRLKVFTLSLPPLRARREDILPLARQMLGNEETLAIGFTKDAEKALLCHPWPGNVRELSNAVRHGAALARGKLIALAELPDDLQPGKGTSPPAQKLRTLEEVEREHVLAILDICGGRQSDAARILGIGRNTLWRKLGAWSASPPRPRAG